MCPNMSGRYPTSMAPPKSAAPHAVPALQVTDDRLPRDQELVHEDVPRAPSRAARPPARARIRSSVLGPDLEVVVDHGHLAVEKEPGIGGVALEEVQQTVDQVHQPQPEASGTARTTPGPSGCGGRWRFGVGTSPQATRPGRVSATQRGAGSGEPGPRVVLGLRQGTFGDEPPRGPPVRRTGLGLAVTVMAGVPEPEPEPEPEPRWWR